MFHKPIIPANFLTIISVILALCDKQTEIESILNRFYLIQNLQSRSPKCIECVNRKVYWEICFPPVTISVHLHLQPQDIKDYLPDENIHKKFKECSPRNWQMTFSGRVWSRISVIYCKQSHAQSKLGSLIDVNILQKLESMRRCTLCVSRLKLRNNFQLNLCPSRSRKENPSEKIVSFKPLIYEAKTKRFTTELHQDHWTRK